MPGSGKSFIAKEMIASLILGTGDDILICDLEGEFGPLCRALGLEQTTVIQMAAGGSDRLNAMYMVEGYGEKSPIVSKSQFIMSLVEQLDKRAWVPSTNPSLTGAWRQCMQNRRKTVSPAPCGTCARSCWSSRRPLPRTLP